MPARSIHILPPRNPRSNATTKSAQCHHAQIQAYIKRKGEHYRLLHKQGEGWCKSVTAVSSFLNTHCTITRHDAARATAAAALLGRPGAGRPGSVERGPADGRVSVGRVLAAQRRPAPGRPAAAGLAAARAAGLGHVGVQLGVQVAPGARHVGLELLVQLPPIHRVQLAVAGAHHAAGTVHGGCHWCGAAGSRPGPLRGCGCGWAFPARCHLRAGA